MSYQSPDPFSSIKGNFRRAGIPVTFGIIGVWIVSFLTSFVTQGRFDEFLACQIDHTKLFPLYSPFTYAFLISDDFLEIIFAGIGLWWIGGSLERSWGAQRYAIAVAVATIIWPVCVYLSSALVNAQVHLDGPWYMITSLFIAWATLNPQMSVSFWGLFRIPAWAFAAFYSGVICFVVLGMQNRFVGLFGLIPCALSWWYVRSGMSSGYQFNTRVPKRGPDLRMSHSAKPLDGSHAGGFNLSNWLRDRAEKRKLKKLWKNSGLSDKDLKR
jgi:hypothetical protein